MAIKRRSFVKWLGASALAGLLWKPIAWAAPARCVEAMRANRYPGPQKQAGLGEIEKPGKWAG